ncbi:acylphosphatase [Oceanobacillus halotolerans]|uniref:acylphosphatase n=1 Tax=Oceanobacillus halotolerans TaxID=2663380 RepID=UPI0013DCDB27|nr:acylphosphatase [Oceanobacillus halotolerans]
MEEQYPDWLSKQIIAGARGFNLDTYLVALEGWRRGLSLEWYYEPSDVTDLKIIGFQPLGKTFSLRSDEKTHFFYRSRGDKVANQAVDIASSKEDTKAYLSKAGVPVPQGIRFYQQERDEAILNEALSLGFPLVVKPTYGSLGKGVITNIRTKEKLLESITYVRDELGFTDLIIERFVQGDDVRVYVVGDSVLGAVKRVPANVVGDGIHSIEDLIKEKNKAKKTNPHLSTRLIKTNDQLTKYLQDQQLSLQDVPAKDEVIYLNGKSNISAGGDSIDVTDELPATIKEIAVQAVQAIPDLKHAGLDLIMDDDQATVIEINATAGIALHIFPLYGKRRNIPAGIIDYYFPETKGLADQRKQIYFDYKTILRLLRSHVAQQLEVPNAPAGKLHARRYVITGKVQGVGFRKWIRKQAIKQGLHGYTRNLKNGKVVVVVAGIDEQIVDGFQEICQKGPKRAEVSEVKAYPWEKQIRIGFEIRDDN